MARLLEVEVRGLEALDSLLDKVVAATDIDDIADEATAILLNRTRTRFLDQVSPDGVPWKESQAAKRRRRTGRGGGTLYDTGRLFLSIQAEVRGRGVRAIFTDVPYAIDHQEGRGQEKREFLGFNQGDANIVRVLVTKRIEAAKR